MNNIDLYLDVNSMNFKQLRSLVSQLYDAYIKLKREYDNNNLNYENLVSSTNKNIKSTDEKLESVYKKIDETGTEFSSRITQTADMIQTQVQKSISDELINYSQITQTSDYIETAVVKTYDTSTYFEKDVSPTAQNTTQEQKGMLCLYNDNYYYYSPITNTWKLYSESEIKSQFVQTAEGFKLTGDVQINGDLITYGTITGDRLRADKLYSREGDIFAYINSGWGDFGIYNDSVPDSPEPNDKNCIFGIYHEPAASINMFSYGNNFLGYNYMQKKTYPKGVWDFSSCTVIGLPTTNNPTNPNQGEIAH